MKTALKFKRRDSGSRDRNNFINLKKTQIPLLPALLISLLLSISFYESKSQTFSKVYDDLTDTYNQVQYHILEYDGPISGGKYLLVGNRNQTTFEDFEYQNVLHLMVVDQSANVLQEKFYQYDALGISILNAKKHEDKFILCGGLEDGIQHMYFGFLLEIDGFLNIVQERHFQTSGNPFIITDITKIDQGYAGVGIEFLSLNPNGTDLRKEDKEAVAFITDDNFNFITANKFDGGSPVAGGFDSDILTKIENIDNQFLVVSGSKTDNSQVSPNPCPTFPFNLTSSRALSLMKLDISNLSVLWELNEGFGYNTLSQRYCSNGNFASEHISDFEYDSPSDRLVVSYNAIQGYDMSVTTQAKSICGLMEINNINSTTPNVGNTVDLEGSGSSPDEVLWINDILLHNSKFIVQFYRQNRNTSTPDLVNSCISEVGYGLNYSNPIICKDIENNQWASSYKLLAAYPISNGFYPGSKTPAFFNQSVIVPNALNEGLYTGIHYYEAPQQGCPPNCTPTAPSLIELEINVYTTKRPFLTDCDYEYYPKEISPQLIPKPAVTTSGTNLVDSYAERLHPILETLPYNLCQVLDGSDDFRKADGNLQGEESDFEEVYTLRLKNDGNYKIEANFVISEMVLRNSNGQIVERFNSQNIKLDEYSKGIYFLEIRSNSKQYHMEKLIKF